jgi:hypothetical protein
MNDKVILVVFLEILVQKFYRKYYVVPIIWSQ